MILLVDKAQTASLRRKRGHVLVVHEHPAGLQARVSCHRFQECSLARPGRSDDQRVSAPGNLQRNIPQIEVAHPDVQLLQPDHPRSSGWSTRTTIKTVRATRSRITAAGTAAFRP